MFLSRVNLQALLTRLDFSKSMRQAKATDMDERACGKEVMTEKGLLKPQVRRFVTRVESMCFSWGETA